jgi:hypothetical protein
VKFETQADWDTAFPHGAIGRWASYGDPESIEGDFVTMQIPWIKVESQDPYVVQFFNDRQGIAYVFQIKEVEQIRTKPVLVVLVHFADSPFPLLLGGNIPPGLVTDPWWVQSRENLQKYGSYYTPEQYAAGMMG